MPRHKELDPHIGFWKKLRQHRRAVEISQKELAPILKKPQTQDALSRREKHGGPLPPRERVIFAASRLGLNPADREELLSLAGYSFTLDFWNEIARHVAPGLVEGEPTMSKVEVQGILERASEIVGQLDQFS